MKPRTNMKKCLLKKIRAEAKHRGKLVEERDGIGKKNGAGPENMNACCETKIKIEPQYSEYN